MRHFFIKKKPGNFRSRACFLQDIYFLRGLSIAACAAASRAIGTRNGEQLT